MSVVHTRTPAQISRPSVLDTREFEVQNGSRVAQVTAMFNDTVIDVQHLGQTRDRRKSAPTWLAIGGAVALSGAALFGHEVAQDWDSHSERVAQAAEVGKPAPARPGTGLGGLGFGLAMLGLVPLGVGFTRLQDRGRRAYTLGEGHDATMHVPAATLPGGESFPLVQGDGDYALQFTAEMQGELSVDGHSSTLAALIEGGRATRVGAAYSVPLPPGAQARVRHGALTFFIHSVAPGVVMARKSEIDKPFWVTNSGAAAVLGSLLVLTHMIPGEAGALSGQDEREGNRFIGYVTQPEQAKEEEVVEDEVVEQAGGVAGERHSGDEGKAGSPKSSKPAGRYAMKGSATIPTMARNFDPEMQARSAGILGVMQRTQGHFMASPGGSYAQGSDDADAWGQIVGTQVGESYGNGGIGLVGSGRGGGGLGQGTIGLGSTGLIGHNKAGGGGTGMRNTTGFKDRGPRVPNPRLGIAQIQGGLDKDLIRRVVRAHINEVRYCYNQGLARDPNLKGRVAVQFQINGAGKVPSAVVSESDIKDNSVASCIAQSVRRWSFPKPDGGGTVIVTYPFVLQAD